MPFRWKEEKDMLGIISKLGIKLEANDGYKSTPDNRIKKPRRPDYDYTEEDIKLPDGLTLDRIPSIKSEYSADDNINIPEYRQDRYERYRPRACDLRRIGERMKTEIEDYSKVGRMRSNEFEDEYTNHLGIKTEYPY